MKPNHKQQAKIINSKLQYFELYPSQLDVLRHFTKNVFTVMYFLCAPTQALNLRIQNIEICPCVSFIINNLQSYQCVLLICYSNSVNNMSIIIHSIFHCVVLSLQLVYVGAGGGRLDAVVLGHEHDHEDGSQRPDAAPEADHAACNRRNNVRKSSH